MERKKQGKGACRWKNASSTGKGERGKRESVFQDDGIGLKVKRSLTLATPEFGQCEKANGEREGEAGGDGTAQFDYRFAWYLWMFGT